MPEIAAAEQIRNPIPATGTPILEIRDLHATTADKEVVRGISLTIRAGERHAIMGPNGSGKSSLTNTLMGHPAYTITAGEILLDGKDITHAAVDERARAGLFLCMQYPVAVPGVTVANLMRSAVKARRGKDAPMGDFRGLLKSRFKSLDIDQAFATRAVNEGFSGGEKKRMEVLQMSVLEPRLALLDEIDSGLDIDALKVVAEGIMAACNDQKALLMVTHYQRLLNYVPPTHVHVLMGGRLVKSGGPELALALEEKGYDWLTPETEA